MKKNFQTSLFAKILLFVSLWLLLVGIDSLNFKYIRELENKTWDWRAKLTQKYFPPETKIKIINIDQISLDYLEVEYGLTWPIPRDTYVYLINYFKEAGAKGVAFDVLFTENSSQSLEGDILLADASKGEFPVIHSFTLNTYEKYLNPERKSALELDFKQFNQYINSHSLESFSSEKLYHSVTLPYKELLTGNSHLGSVQASPDSDGIFRRYALLGTFDKLFLPSLPLSLYLAPKDDLNQKLKLNVNESDDSLVVRITDREIGYESHSFASILQSKALLDSSKEPLIPSETFKDSWIFIGCTAPGLLDFRPNSIEENGYGVTFTATTFDNILNNEFVYVANGKQKFVGYTLLLLITFLISILRHVPAVKSSLFFINFIFVLFLSYYLATINIWSPIVIPIFGFLTFLFGSLLIDFQFEGKRHKFLRKAFQHYLSPDLISEIVENPDSLILGGERREISTFFSDIVGFTSAAEVIDPDKIVLLLNDYLTIFTEIILKNSGTLDKYVGDAVVAFWNAPIKNTQHPALALKSAIECIEKLEEKKVYFLEKYKMFPETRIGLNVAQATIGNFGSNTRFSYTAIGDGVNLASRLEGVNKVFGSNILLTEELKNLCNSVFEFRKVGKIQVVGKNQESVIFEPKTRLNSFLFNRIEKNIYETALSCFTKGNLQESKQEFMKIPEDYVARAYLRRIEVELLQPQKSFDPVWKLNQK